LHWNFEDPSILKGTEEEKLKLTMKIRDKIKNKVNTFINNY
jgi:hypothetical protein